MTDNIDEQGADAGWRWTVGTASCYHDNYSLQPGEHVGQLRCSVNIQHLHPLHLRAAESVRIYSKIFQAIYFNQSISLYRAIVQRRVLQCSYVKWSLGV